MPFPFEINPETVDQVFMLEALKEAWIAFKAGEVPVGAVLVKGERIIARGHNRVESLQNATAHAEMLCLTAAERACGNWRLTETTLYCTMEPCSMCAGAMLLSRIDTLVWGAADFRHGANGSWVDLFAKTHPIHTIEIRKGVLGDFAALLMRRFFQEQRQKGRTKQNDNLLKPL